MQRWIASGALVPTVGKRARTPSPQVLSTFTRAADAIDLEQAAQVFDILDADGDGTIGLDELRSASHDPVVQDFVERSKCQMLRALLNRDGVEPARARRVLQAVDADLSGKIDRSTIGADTDRVAATPRPRRG